MDKIHREIIVMIGQHILENQPCYWADVEIAKQMSRNQHKAMTKLNPRCHTFIELDSGYVEFLICNGNEYTNSADMAHEMARYFSDPISKWNLDYAEGT
jgi:hypothetical protein